MWEYIAKSTSAFIMGFAPFVEIYIAIPASIAMGLDYVSAGLWCSLGNYLPVPLIVFFHEQLMRVPRIGPWLQRLASGRGRRILNRHGPAFLVIVTPWIGIWVVVAAAQVLGMSRWRIMFYSFISIAGYAAILTIGIALGIEWWDEIVAAWQHFFGSGDATPTEVQTIHADIQPEGD